MKNSLAAIYSARRDGTACPACQAMHGRATASLQEAQSWQPNPECTSPGGCRCATVLGMTPQPQGSVPAPTQDEAAETARSQKLDAVSLAVHKAKLLEQTDPQRAIALYRDAVEMYLTVGCELLGQRDVRRELLLVFGRLSLMLKRAARPVEALEVLERAAFLGLLDCADCEVEGHREALAERPADSHPAITKVAP